ncbi:MAG: dTMP kinase [Candidatus Nitronauta litoralis]|uniref:Thymidylate kinase n=1 Tax=Candidatus Nitronauta litoralis TaxID=2705533 RepID=A0A7T0BZM3_9BACT|nr:MAG: dTMP kinase [Candidatus Nitronauta litoralis]
MLDKGFLIVAEGIDGAGKSSQLKKLAENLRVSGHDVVELREPTNGTWGQKIRRLLTEGRDGITPEEELSYFNNDRREDVALNIQPALERKAIVLIDRYYYSTAAYQGALGFDPEAICQENETFAPRPDLVLMFSIDPEVGLERISSSRDGFSSFEKLDYLKRVQAIFNTFEGLHIKRIDANREMDDVQQDVQNCVSAFLKTGEIK